MYAVVICLKVSIRRICGATFPIRKIKTSVDESSDTYDTIEWLINSIDTITSRLGVGNFLSRFLLDSRNDRCSSKSCMCFASGTNSIGLSATICTITDFLCVNVIRFLPGVSGIPQNLIRRQQILILW